MQKLSLKVLDSFVESRTEQQIFPKKTKRSIPLVTKKEDKLFYAIFLYDDDLTETHELERPFAWSILPVRSQITCDFTFNYCSIVDFVNTKSHPFRQKVTAAVGDSSPIADANGNYSQLESLMDSITDFAFYSTLTDDQQGIVDRFKKLFLQTAYVGFYSFYQAIAPDFLEWVGLTLVAKSDSSIIKKEINQDITHNLMSNTILLEKIDEKVNKLEEIQLAVKNILTNTDFEIEKEIILIIDHINKSIASYPSIKTNNQQKELELVKAVRQDLIDLLYRHNIEPYKVSDDKINLNFQKVVETKPTTDEKLNRTVYKRLAVGWSRGNTVIRPEHIVAYLCEDGLN